VIKLVHEMRQSPTNNSAIENKCVTQQGIGPEMRIGTLIIHPNKYTTFLAKKYRLTLSKPTQVYEYDF